MAITAANLIARGMNHEQANSLVAQFATTVSADTLLRMGFPVPVANELAAQKNGASFSETKLMGLGMPPALAAYIAANG